MMSCKISIVHIRSKEGIRRTIELSFPLQGDGCQQAAHVYPRKPWAWVLQGVPVSRWFSRLDVWDHCEQSLFRFLFVEDVVHPHVWPAYQLFCPIGWWGKVTRKFVSTNQWMMCLASWMACGVVDHLHCEIRQKSSWFWGLGIARALKICKPSSWWW